MSPPSLTPREFNSYGARRGNDAVMTRGTFASIKLQNRFIGKSGPKTLHIPSGQTVSRRCTTTTHKDRTVCCLAVSEKAPPSSVFV